MGFNDILVHCRQNSFLGTLYWPDVEDGGKLCVHIKISIFRRIICNTCGFINSNFRDKLFDPNATYCGICGNVFCYDCLPVVDQNQNPVKIEESTLKQRINVQCHLCTSCPIAIKASTQVCLLHAFL